MTARNIFAAKVLAASLGVMGAAVAATGVHASQTLPTQNAQDWADPVTPLARWGFEMVEVSPFQAPSDQDMERLFEALDDTAATLDTKLSQMSAIAAEMAAAARGAQSPTEFQRALSEKFEEYKIGARQTGGDDIKGLRTMVKALGPDTEGGDLAAYVIDQETTALALVAAISGAAKSAGISPQERVATAETLEKAAADAERLRADGPFAWEPEAPQMTGTPSANSP